MRCAHIGPRRPDTAMVSLRCAPVASVSSFWLDAKPKRQRMSRDECPGNAIVRLRVTGRRVRREGGSGRRRAAPTLRMPRATVPSWTRFYVGRASHRARQRSFYARRARIRLAIAFASETPSGTRAHRRPSATSRRCGADMEGAFVIHEGAFEVKCGLVVFDVRLLGGGGHGRFSRWVKGFRGFAPGFVCSVAGRGLSGQAPGCGQG